MRRTSADQWATRIERWQRSGLGAKEFGQRHGLDPKQLSWWKWHLNRIDAKEKPLRQGPSDECESEAVSTAIRFLPVHVIEDEPPGQEDRGGPGVEIGLCNGRVVRVHQGTDLDWLSDVLRVVESSGDARC